MNARQLYLAWVRSKYPTAYVTAMRRAVGKPRSLGGLNDDLMLAGLGQDIATSIDTGSGSDFSSFFPAPAADFSVVPAGSWADPVMASIPAPSVADVWSAPANFSYTPPAGGVASTPSTLPGMFNNFITAVASIANTQIATKSSAQSQLLATNTARAARGQPPVDANGIPVTSASLMPANASIYALEQRLAGAGGAASWVMMAGLGVLAFVLFGRRGARRR